MRRLRIGNLNNQKSKLSVMIKPEVIIIIDQSIGFCVLVQHDKVFFISIGFKYRLLLNTFKNIQEA